MEFSEEDKKILGNHVTSLDGDVYCIYNLPPEVVAVLFAYVSRSPESFRTNLLKLIKSRDLDMGSLISSFQSRGMEYGQAREKAMKFHERWVVGYGHSSIAEHAVASVAIENVSILATKVIEDNRLASFTEKSTRYQIFDRNRYYRPPILMKSKYSDLYVNTCNSLFDFYTENMEKAIGFVKGKYPKPPEMAEKRYDSVSKARACDIMRYVLPASTLTNLGMTINARNLEHSIRKLLSSPLTEMNGIGEGIKREVTKIIPTLVKYADRNEYIVRTNETMESAIRDLSMKGGDGEKPVVIVDYDRDAENKLVASILYGYSQQPYDHILEQARKMERREKERIIDEFLKRRGDHDQPLRELEHVYYTFDILVDYGAFRDIQRHRMATQTNQDLTTHHGYSTPKELEGIGIMERYEELMKMAKYAFREISKEYPKEAQYVVPLAFRKRTLFTWNLRELFHFIRLRSGKEGHESYRRIAIQVYEELEKIHPLFARYIKVERAEGPSR